MVNYIPGIGGGDFRYDRLGHPGYADDNYLHVC